MTTTTFKKILSANDVGATGGHQGGILVPKTARDLIEFLPKLDSNTKNPDAWIECVDEAGILHRFRFVYYNNSLHDSNGTRNEYRITYMTKYFRTLGAREGDTLEISRVENREQYSISVKRQLPEVALHQEQGGYKIKLSSSWSRVH
ncbi:restriction endonuclease [Rugamonas sp. FT107W]|uniref:Restriction endonuclease n=1 Tax=Duganella vulcania TaxID=2692166 RepID=A0A845HJN3_9BURK|nr:EcoRII N-terminal effector-binding domain-containing protein [Duganella vulcania]MYN17124.1 restriction endonuclease [Duganella vulcania]